MSMAKGAERKESYAVRFFLTSLEDFERYEKLKTLLIVKGIDFSVWFAEKAFASQQFYWDERVENREIVDGEWLKEYVRGNFGKELTKGQLNDLRKHWIEGEHYWSAPNGNVRAYRYDFEKCVEELDDFGNRVGRRSRKVKEEVS